ncbi:MAG: hypothetical protein K5872_21020 [Rhizobiaceae bacterium]|nr:hypothetical protein [Rhizobiaceae bacterium]MCV0408699.1 hypothetical protein [Rhizobiaceae bacterium]
MTQSPRFIHHLARAFAVMRQRRADARTARLIAELPRHLRKDIGWPDEAGPMRWR